MFVREVYRILEVSRLKRFSPRFLPRYQSIRIHSKLPAVCLQYALVVCLIAIPTFLLAGNADFAKAAQHFEANENTVFATKPRLTAAEVAWLKHHPVIRIGIDPNYAPYSLKDRNGDLVGISPDFIKLIERSLGVVLAPIPDLTWPQIVQGVKDETLDVIATAVKTPERTAFLNFTDIYLPTPLVIMTRKDDIRFRDAADLSGKKVALVQGYSSSQRVVSEVTGINAYMVGSPLEGLSAVAAGGADAYVGVLGVNAYFASKHGLSNLKVAAKYEASTNGQRFAIRKDWTILASILDKALNAIPETKKAQIFGKWISVTSDLNAVAPLKFTNSEIEWLTRNQKIRVGINNRWPPMDFVDANGRPRGIGPGYIEALRSRLPLEIEIVPGNWAEIYESVKEAKVDALMGITPTRERKDHFNFTDPYLSIAHAIFGRPDDVSLARSEGLRGRTIGLEKGFFLVKLLKKKYPGIHVREYASTLDVIYAVSRGEVDAYIGNRAVALYEIETNLISNIEELGTFRESRSVNAVGVRKDLPILRDIIQKGLMSIKRAERQAILHEWVDPAPIDPDKLLTDKQKSWLEAHSPIRLIYESGWVPFDFTDKDGRYVGMAADVLNLINRMIPIDVRPMAGRFGSGSFTDSQTRDFDLVATVVKSDASLANLAFTENFLSFPFVILMHKDSTPVATLQALRLQQVAVINGHAISELLDNLHLGMNIVAFDRADEALTALKERKVDAYIETVPTINYARRFVDIDDLRIVAPTPYTVGLSFGVRKELPELLEIMNRAIGNLTNLQKRSITQTWTNARIHTQTDWVFIIQLVGFVVGVSCVVLIFIIVWNRRLAGEISSRNRIEGELKKEIAIKNTFFSIVAHDLRSPFSTLLGMTKSMHHLADKLSKEQLVAQAGRVNAAAERVFELVENLLEWSSVQMSGTESEPETIDIGELAKECIDLFHATAEEKNITLVSNIANCQAWANRDMVVTVIRNLVNNGLKFTASEGQVVLSAKSEGNEVQVLVRDTGVGIPDEIRERVFEIDQKTSTKGTSDELGSGLGLPLCAELIAKNNGKIWIESEPNEGCTVFFTLTASH